VPVVLSILGFLCLLGGASLFTLSRSWDRILLALAVQSLGLGLMSAQISPWPVAAAKTVVGWIAIALLALTLSRESPQTTAGDKSVQFFFRFSLILFLFSTILALLPQLGGVFRDPPASLALVSCYLLGAGLINLGLSEHPLRSAASLLTVMQGFELGYLWIEQSLLVLALLAVTDLAMVMAMIILQSRSAPDSSAEDRSAP
jgi:hypothetical protein